MKKVFFLVPFSLMSISAFASGHGTDAFGMLLGLMVGLFAYTILFIILTILTGINLAFPGNARSVICAIFFSVFTLIYLYLFFKTLSIFSDDYSGLSAYADLSSYILWGDVFFGFLVALNFIFIVLSFIKLKKKKALQSERGK